MLMESEKCTGLRGNFCGFNFWLVLIIVICLEVISSSALFEGCDHQFIVNNGDSYLLSPNYPNKYPPYTSCRYSFSAQIDSGIRVKCNLDMPKGPTNCSTERFYFSREGDLNMVGAEEFCGVGTIERDSLFRTVSMAYVSYGSSGKFKCVLTAQPRPCDCGWSLKTRIRNGQDALPNEFPSAVALKDRTSNLQSFCGGTIISHYYILTAAHCTKSYHDVRYIVALVGGIDISNRNGSYAAQYDIAQKFEHPSYSGARDTNDIAILRTILAMEWSRGVGPICLPPAAVANNDFNYQTVTAIGWGTLFNGGIRSSILKKTQLLITDNMTCGRYYANTSIIDQSQLCTYDSLGQGRDTCEFDSGGPVIHRNARQFQVGIISFGTPCGVGEYPIGVNTRVTSYLEWIQQITQYTTCRVAFN